MAQPKSLALVLSGGGVRGLMHLGILQALEEHDIRVEAISGASMGAIVGAFYAAGMQPKVILELMTDRHFIRMFDFKFGRSGLLKLAYLEESLQKHIPHNSFSGLQIPLFVCATNLNREKFRIFGKGDLHQAVMASAAIPVLFEPVEIEGEKYIDGGLLNNLPAAPLAGRFDFLVGVHVNRYRMEGAYDSMKNIATKAFTLALLQNVVPNKQLCDHVIEPVLDRHYDLLDFDEADRIFAAGYEAGKSFAAEFFK